MSISCLLLRIMSNMFLIILYSTPGSIIDLGDLCFRKLFDQLKHYIPSRSADTFCISSATVMRCCLLYSSGPQTFQGRSPFDNKKRKCTQMPISCIIAFHSIDQLNLNKISVEHFFLLFDQSSCFKHFNISLGDHGPDHIL